MTTQPENFLHYGGKQDIDSLLQTGVDQRKGFSDLGLLAVTSGILGMRSKVITPVIWMGGPPIFEIFKASRFIFDFPAGVAKVFLLFFAVSSTTAFLGISEPGMGTKRQKTPRTKTNR